MKTDSTANLGRSIPGQWLGSIAAALLILHAVLAIDTLRKKAVTVDEGGHLPAGITYWQKRTFGLFHHNPPLVKMLAALPAMAFRPTVDYSKSWKRSSEQDVPVSPVVFGWEFMYANADRYLSIYFWSRLVIVGFSILTAVMIFLWARELFGDAAGLVGLALWCFNPSVIGHAGIVATDIGAAAMGLLASFHFRRFLQEQNCQRAAIAGLLLGLAMLTKFSLIFLLGFWPLLWLLWSCLAHRSWKDEVEISGEGDESSANQEEAPGSEEQMDENDSEENDDIESRPISSIRKVFGHATLGLLVCLLAVNSGYLFEGFGTPLGDLAFRSRQMTVTEGEFFSSIAPRTNRFKGSSIGWIPVPLPKHFVLGMDTLLFEADFVPGVYLMGTLREMGWWWYYFFALVVKNPLGLWVLTVFSFVAAMLRTDVRASPADEAFLLVPLLLFLVVISVFTKVQIGVRYLLPIFPLWIITISRVGQFASGGRTILKSILALALAWYVFACLRYHPDHIAYFNETVGGPDRGGRYLIDSNLDWGQDLLGLAGELEDGHLQAPFGLAYFGSMDPRILPAFKSKMKDGRYPFGIPPPTRPQMVRLLSIAEDGRLRIAINNFREKHGSAPMSPEDQRELGQMIMQMAGTISRSKDSDQSVEGPRPGRFAISANLVYGMPYKLKDSDGNLWLAHQNAYAWFRKLAPVRKIGYSIYIYEVTLEQANGIRASLGFPRLPE